MWPVSWPSSHPIQKNTSIIWRSERSHSHFIKIEICDIYMYSTYVQIYPPGGSHRQLAAEWKVAGLSPAVELRFLFFSLSLSFFPLSFSPFPLFLPSLPFISPPSFFPFMLAPPCTSMLKHFSSVLTHRKSHLVAQVLVQTTVLTHVFHFSPHS